MPTVTMLVGTTSGAYGALVEGQTVEVDDAIAEQWERHNIAVTADQEPIHPSTLAAALQEMDEQFEDTSRHSQGTTGDSARSALTAPTQRRLKRGRR